MVSVSLYEGNIEHRFPDVPDGYTPAVSSRGYGELKVDPNYQSPEQPSLPGLSRDAIVGQHVLSVLDGELGEAKS